ncbi:ABC transporter substrate-binding protein [Aestuariibius sp. 2305UL40-4]|uniref:ABC transporter substrate-binding protein n=1 Tax=Aestuariibius violaceus TaxID=3234132 RepID=UPI00345E7BB9
MIRLLPFFALIAAPAAAQDCADGQRPFDHAGGTTCIPDDPQRIIGLHDQSVTLALIEMGAPVVGSHGRLDDDGNPYMRSVDLIFGLDFESSDIAFIGAFDAMDFEAIAAAQPDLIIGRAFFDIETRAQYEALAPAVFIENDPKDQLAFSRGVADAAGALDRWEDMHATYRANVDRARAAFPQADGATYGKIQMHDGQLQVYAGYGGLTMVLGDLGFQRIPVAQEMANRGVVWGEEVSLEILPQVEADYLFDTYTIAYGDTLSDPRARFDAALPSWCDALTACAEGRYIVLPREMSTDYSFRQLDMLLHLVTTHVARVPAPS